jgi:hypothetical protein
MTYAQAQTFPRELLTSDLHTKTDYFKNVTIGHPHLANARERLLTAIEDADRDSLIFVYGPTGVGKSTLRISVMNTIISKLLPDLEVDRGRIPIVGLELPAPGPGSFNWSDTFQRLLHKMNEPLVEFKIAPPTELRRIIIPNAGKSSASTYRYAYEQALAARRPVAVLLDDAQYLNKVPSARLLDQLDLVKSIASYVQIPHVLFGTYELLMLRNLSGQISRRSLDIHLPRYKAGRSDRDIFANVVMTFALKMPVEECPNLLEHLDYLMERSAGCVGILKTWLEQSLTEALRLGKKTVTKEHLERRAYSDEALTKIFMEMAEGEDTLLEGGGQYSIQKKRLALPSQGSTSDTAHAIKDRTHRKSRMYTPGQRNPTRDSIGISHSNVVRNA